MFLPGKLIRLFRILNESSEADAGIGMKLGRAKRPRIAVQLIPPHAEPRKHLKFEKERLVIVGTGADPIQMKEVRILLIGYALAEEDRLVSRPAQALSNGTRQVFR